MLHFAKWQFYDKNRLKVVEIVQFLAENAFRFKNRKTQHREMYKINRIEIVENRFLLHKLQFIVSIIEKWIKNTNPARIIINPID